MLETVQTLLEDVGYSNFVMTTDPAAAILLAEEHQPDVLLLDLLMPQIDGFELLAQLRANDLLRFTPVIILTAESDAAAKLRVLE
jgi:CheY-like chemotaxis protein